MIRFNINIFVGMVFFVLLRFIIVFHFCTTQILSINGFITITSIRMTKIMTTRTTRTLNYYTWNEVSKTLCHSAVVHSSNHFMLYYYSKRRYYDLHNDNNDDDVIEQRYKSRVNLKEYCNTQSSTNMMAPNKNRDEKVILGDYDDDYDENNILMNITDDMKFQFKEDLKMDRIKQDRIKQVKLLKDKIRKEKDATASMDLPNQPLVTTISGGTQTIFDMARRMAAGSIEKLNPSKPTTGSIKNNAIGINVDNKLSFTSSSSVIVDQSSTDIILPRWHPTNGIVSYNPEFRTQSPVMNNVGYANMIWKNVRKKNRISFWKYALRTYDRMLQQQKMNKTLNIALRVRPTNIHYEGALLACSKLGDYKRAFQIYEQIQNNQIRKIPIMTATKRLNIPSRNNPQQNQMATSSNNIMSSDVVLVTDNMIMSMIRSCVRASNLKRNKDTNELIPIDQRRIPLDMVIDKIINNMEDQYQIPICAIHINPLSRAYQNLGLYNEANQLLHNHLQERISGPESEENDRLLSLTRKQLRQQQQKQAQQQLKRKNNNNQNNRNDQNDNNDSLMVYQTKLRRGNFNIYDVQAKDKGSYTLLVQSAVLDSNWVNAIDALKNMTEVGLYPSERHLKSWK